MSDIQRYEQPGSILSVEEIRSQNKAIQMILKNIMREGEHYGTIPGCGEKKALLKPGAEKIASAFRLAIRPEWTMRDLGNGHREYEITCQVLSPHGEFLGQGVGSCSTMESKYRYRSENTGREVPSEYWNSGKDQDFLGGPGYFARKIKDKWMIFHKEEHPDPADYYNTVLKMGKKRAMVDAILTVTAASDIFLQDVEEDGYQEQREQHEQPPAEHRQSPPNTQQQGNGTISEPQQKRLYALAKNSGKGNDEVKDYIAKLGFPSAKDITRDKYEAICTWVMSDAN